jgi:hypothetical protein
MQRQNYRFLFSVLPDLGSTQKKLYRPRPCVGGSTASALLAGFSGAKAVEPLRQAQGRVVHFLLAALRLRTIVVSSRDAVLMPGRSRFHRTLKFLVQP